MEILCIGDSLTYGYGVGRDETWCALASRITGHDFVNRGVNGATTGEMLDQELWGDEVLVMGGLNDLFMGISPSVPLDNILSLCARARSKGMRPAVGIPMGIASHVSEGWCDGPVDIGKVRAAYAELAEALLRRCAGEGIRTVDFRPVIGDAELSFDGIHLNRQGHRKMAAAVALIWPPAAD